jgi:hypothetical protein
VKEVYLKLLQVPLLLLAPFELIKPFRQRLRYKIALNTLYTPRPDDVFIATYPKSGTTLMQMMLYQLTTDGSMDFSHICSISPYFEVELMNSQNASIRETLESLPSPRFFKSHLGHDDLPRQARFIYIVRNVRDVVTSAYHHQSLMFGREIDRARFVKRLLRTRSRQHSWFRHLEAWWPHRHDDNVLFLTYEGIVQDLEGTARKVAAFCGITIDESSLPRVVERCGFAFMKQHWDKFDPRLRQLGRRRSEFIRKGVPGAGRAELTPEQEEIVRWHLRELAAKLGLSSEEPYIELFS